MRKNIFKIKLKEKFLIMTENKKNNSKKIEEPKEKAIKSTKSGSADNQNQNHNTKKEAQGPNTRR